MTATRRLPLARAVTSPLPSAGLPFRDAMVWCGHAGTVAEFQRLNLRTILPRGTVGALTEGEWSALDAWRDALVRSQLTRLRYGYQRAKAFMPGSLEAVPVPPEWWEGASVDWVANTATAHGTPLSGVLIYAGEELVAATEAPETAQDAPVEARKPVPEPDHPPPTPAPKKRGPVAKEQPRVEKEMHAHIAAAENCAAAVASLRALKVKELAGRYNTKVYTAGRALRAVVKALGIVW